MDGHSHNQPATSESSAVIKPVALYYYVDQFERLYQQSPMAKLYRQELTQPPNPKGLTPQEGRGRQSAKAKGFKLPTAGAKEKRTSPSHEILEAQPKGEEGMELKVQAGTGSWNGRGECVLSRMSDECRSISGMSESSVTIGEGTASDSSLHEVEIPVGKKPQLSPRPRLQSPSGPEEDRWRKRSQAPNLHNLIKRLKSPEKAGPPAPSEFKRPARSPETTKVTDLEKVDGHIDSLSDLTPRHKEVDDEGPDPCDVGRSNLEPTDGSRVSSRHSSRASFEPDANEMPLLSLTETPNPGVSGSKRKCVPQRRLLQELRLANNQDRSHHSPGASEQNLLYRMRHADIPPINGRPGTSIPSRQEHEVTAKSAPDVQVCPSNREVALSEETPVNRGSSRRKMRTKGSKLNVGEVIRNLQAGQEKTSRSAASYKDTVHSDVLTEDQPVHCTEPSSPTAVVESVNGWCEDGSDEETEVEAEEELMEEEDFDRLKVHETDPASSVSPRSIEPETDTRRITRRQAEMKANKLTRRKAQEDKFDDKELIPEELIPEKSIPEESIPEESMPEESIPEESIPEESIPDPPEVTKKQETIINRWIIKPVPSCKGVCVEGHRVGDKDDQFWHSTAIMVRINPRLLATKSGALYRLAGKMDRPLSMEQGFSETLIRSFQKGFPDNWRDLLYDHFTSEEKKKAEMKSNKSPWTKERPKVTQVASHVDPSVPDLARKAKRKNQVDVTPQNLRVKDLQRSSSGRLIKPPLAYWTGQRIRHNTSLDFVEILLGTEDCTSSSVNQISLQDSLELGPRDKRAIKRTSNVDTLQALSAGKKHSRQSRMDNSDVDEESSPYPDPESQTGRRDSQAKWSASKTKNKCFQEAGSSRQVWKGRGRRKAATRDASENIEGTRNEPSVFPPRELSRYPQRSRRNVHEESRMEGAVESCSSDYPGEVTDDTASTSATNPVIGLEGNDKNLREAMHPSSRSRGSKQPPPPSKNKPKRSMERASCGPQRSTPGSPLYYQISPQSEDGSLLESRPAIRKAPSSNRNNPANATSSSTLGPSSSSDPGRNSESTATDFLNAAQARKTSSERGRPPGAVGTYNLQREVLAVVEKHKQGRMARMRERTKRLSDKQRSDTGRLPSAPDVYELSDDEEPAPRRIPYLPRGASTNATTAESVSNWSEEGDKSVNMTWVTRAKPHRRNQATLKDAQYRNEESTTTETTTATSTGEAEDIVNPLSSDRETTHTETSADELVLDFPTRRPKKSLGSRLKSTRTRQGHQPVLDQTSDDEQVEQTQKPSRSTKRTTPRHGRQEVSSQDTDNTPRGPNKAMSLRLKASSGDTDETIKAGETNTRKGRSKKAVFIQRYQPRRNCKKSGSESDTNNPLQEVENTANHGRSEPVPRQRKGVAKRIPNITSEVNQKPTQENNGKWTGDSDKTPRAFQGAQVSISKMYGSQKEQLRETPRREVNGKPEFRDVERDVLQTREAVTLQCASKSSPTKSCKQQSKQQENQTQAAVALTAKVGTMKRKRQLRELVEQHNQGYQDDIFDSTPFKKQKKLKIPLGEWSTEDDSQEGPAGKTPGSARFKTPSARYEGVLPLSDKKTPYSNLISPGLLPSVDRKHVDQYIHGLQKKKKGRGFVQRPYTANQLTNVGRGPGKSGGAALVQAMGDRAADMFHVTPVSDSDPDEDRDYYWSDEEH